MGKQREKRFFTAAESAQIWDRWQRGEGLKVIGRLFGKTFDLTNARGSCDRPRFPDVCFAFGLDLAKYEAVHGTQVIATPRLGASHRRA